jgi:hypothetical protein
MRNAWALLVLGGCAGSQAAMDTPAVDAAEAVFPEGDSQIVVRADDMPWGPCPPTLPAGCQIAVLEGDPKQPTLFTLRFRTDHAFELRPHTHPRHERVTILEGKVGVGFGDVIERDNVRWFGPGDYYVNAKGAHHFVLVDEGAVLQITGIGPWTVNYLE